MEKIEVEGAKYIVAELQPLTGERTSQNLVYRACIFKILLDVGAVVKKFGPFFLKPGIERFFEAVTQCNNSAESNRPATGDAA